MKGLSYCPQLLPGIFDRFPKKKTHFDSKKLIVLNWLNLRSWLIEKWGVGERASLAALRTCVFGVLLIEISPRKAVGGNKYLPRPFTLMNKGHLFAMCPERPGWRKFLTLRSRKRVSATAC